MWSPGGDIYMQTSSNSGLTWGKPQVGCRAMCALKCDEVVLTCSNMDTSMSLVCMAMSYLSTCHGGQTRECGGADGDVVRRRGRRS